MNLRDVAVIYNSGNYHGYAPTVACKKPAMSHMIHAAQEDCGNGPDNGGHR